MSVDALTGTVSSFDRDAARRGVSVEARRSVSVMAQPAASKRFVRTMARAEERGVAEELTEPSRNWLTNQL